MYGDWGSGNRAETPGMRGGVHSCPLRNLGENIDWELLRSAPQCRPGGHRHSAISIRPFSFYVILSILSEIHYFMASLQPITARQRRRTYRGMSKVMGCHFSPHGHLHACGNAAKQLATAPPSAIQFPTRRRLSLGIRCWKVRGTGDGRCHGRRPTRFFSSAA